jgi:hypothetical protein
MRLTLIIASAIFSALFAYARLLAMAQDSSRPMPYEGVVASPTVHLGVFPSRSN